MFNFSNEDLVIEKALEILESRIRNDHELHLTADSPKDTIKKYLRLKYANVEREEFKVMFFDGSNRLVKTEEFGNGSISEAAVYPREVVKAAMKCNAANAVLVHNHPSGDPTPSDADLHLTNSLGVALSLVDCQVRDHIIVGERETHSFAENGDFGRCERKQSQDPLSDLMKHLQHIRELEGTE